jgi:hypothetical protein
MHARRLAALAVSVALAGAETARAADGVREIDHVCASGAGCFPGDTAGYPVQITAPGSYRLTGDLVVPDAATHGLSLSTGDVTIDLAGFAIRGEGVCSGTPLACAPSGNGSAIAAEGRERVTVRNGVVRGMGGTGLVLGRGGLVVGVHVSDSGGTGILVRDASAVVRSTAIRNEGAGILTNQFAVVVDTTASGNGSHGLSAGQGSATSRNAARTNQGTGVIAGFGGSITESASSDNGEEGFQPSIAVLSRSSATANDGAGVRLESNGGTAISELTARNNTGAGLDFHISADSGYRACVISNNTSGTELGDAVVLDENLCNGSTTCP